MWDEVRKLADIYDSAVLTTTDADGYPTSIRVTPTYNDHDQTITVTVPDYADLQAGSAGLGYHKHNDALFNLSNHAVRGRVEQTGDTWVFHPEKVLAGTADSGMEAFKFTMRCRADAKSYLEKHNMPRPKVDWASIKALRKKAGN